MNNGSTLWWSYDPENRSFGSLPAGPMLLPAIGILAFVSIARMLQGNGPTPESVLGRKVIGSNDYKRCKARQDYLVQKKIEEGMGTGPGLSVAEHHELMELYRRYPF